MNIAHVVREKAKCNGQSPKPTMSKISELTKFANETPVVLSLLYDLDLMPEQTISKPVYAQTMNVIAHCMTLQKHTLAHAASICRGVYGNSSSAEHAIAEECARRIEAEMGKVGQ